MNSVYSGGFSKDFIHDNGIDFTKRLIQDDKETERVSADCDDSYLVALVEPSLEQRYISLTDLIRAMTLNYLPLQQWNQSKPIEAVARIYIKDGNVQLIKIHEVFFQAKGESITFKDYERDHSNVTIISPPGTLDNLMNRKTKIGLYRRDEWGNLGIEYSDDLKTAWEASNCYPDFHPKYSDSKSHYCILA